MFLSSRKLSDGPSVSINYKIYLNLFIEKFDYKKWDASNLISLNDISFKKNLKGKVSQQIILIFFETTWTKVPQN